jgi:hypothetical protein
VEGVAGGLQSSSTVLETLKAIRLRAHELREQAMARYEQLVIDRGVRARDGCCPTCASSLTRPPARSIPPGSRELFELTPGTPTKVQFEEQKTVAGHELVAGCRGFGGSVDLTGAGRLPGGHQVWVPLAVAVVVRRPGAR